MGEELSDGKRDGGSNDQIVALKNGVRMEVRRVGGILARLKIITDGRTDLMALLSRLADGARCDPSAATTAELRGENLLTPEGELRPDYRDVFLSAYRQTAEGVVLADPFAATTEDEQDALRAAHRDEDERLRRWLFEPVEQPDDGPPTDPVRPTRRP